MAASSRWRRLVVGRSDYLVRCWARSGSAPWARSTIASRSARWSACSPRRWPPTRSGRPAWAGRSSTGAANLAAHDRLGRRAGQRVQPHGQPRRRHRDRRRRVRGGRGRAAATQGETTLAALAFGSARACFAFLRFNLAAPARVFLGDGGSMPIGFLIAAGLWRSRRPRVRHGRRLRGRPLRRPGGARHHARRRVPGPPRRARALRVDVTTHPPPAAAARIRRRGGVGAGSRPGGSLRPRLPAVRLVHRHGVRGLDRLRAPRRAVIAPLEWPYVADAPAVAPFPRRPSKSPAPDRGNRVSSVPWEQPHGSLGGHAAAVLARHRPAQHGRTVPSCGHLERRARPGALRDASTPWRRWAQARTRWRTRSGVGRRDGSGAPVSSPEVRRPDDDAALGSLVRRIRRCGPTFSIRTPPRRGRLPAPPPCSPARPDRWSSTPTTGTCSRDTSGRCATRSTELSSIASGVTDALVV